MVRYDAAAGAQGALSGASIGSMVSPGLGTGIGAVAGGLLGFFSPKKKKKKLSTFDKTQQEVFGNYAQGLQGKGAFADLFGFDQQGATNAFNQNVAQPAYENFNQNIVPSITGAFRGGNLQNSSYLGGALSKAGTDVQKDLNAQLSNMIYNGNQASLDRRLNAINSIINTQTHAYEQPSASPLDQILGAFSEGTGKFAGEQFSRWLYNKSWSNASGNTPGSTQTPGTS